jgi:DNA modification methylase
MDIKNRIIKSELVSWKKFEFIQSDSFKKLSQEAYSKLKESIIKNNFIESFKLWRSGKKLYCLDGYHRILVLKDLISEGYKVPDKFRADFINCKDRKEASRLVLIYSSIYAQVTEEGFLKYLEENKLTFEEVKSVIDIPDFNLEYFELKNFTLEVKEDDFNSDEVYESIKKPISKKGDIYQLGPHRLMNGDCTLEEDVKKLMNKELADLIFTDPPYNVDYKSPGGLSYDSKKYGESGGKIFNDNKSDKDCIEFYTAALENLYKFSKDSVCIYWWFAGRNQHINRQAFLKANWYISQTIIWIKNGFVLSRGQDYHRCYEPCLFGWKKGKTHFSNKFINNLQDAFNLDYKDFQELFDVWYVKRDATQNYVHPTQKPVRLPERAINKNSKENDIVLDFFGGSGSTLLGCDQMSRRAFLMELDPKYCDVIVKRYIKFCRENKKSIDIKLNGKPLNIKKYEI